MKAKQIWVAWQPDELRTRVLGLYSNIRAAVRAVSAHKGKGQWHDGKDYPVSQRELEYNVITWEMEQVYYELPEERVYVTAIAANGYEEFGIELFDPPLPDRPQGHLQDYFPRHKEA